jgi:hypothetical protein
MKHKINIRVDDTLYQKIKEHEHDFGGIGMSESVRRLILVALELSKDLDWNEKVNLGLRVIIEQNKDMSK